MWIVLSWHKLDTRSVIFFWSVSLLISKTKTCITKQNVLLKLLEVIVYIHVVFKSTFKSFAHEDATCKTEGFLHMLFLQKEAQINQKNYGTMLFMSKHMLFMTKISSILQKNRPKKRYTPFLHEALQLCSLP